MTTHISRPYRVLLVSHYYPPHVGGIENVVRHEAEHLTRQGAEVTVLTSGDRTRTRYESGVRVVRIAAWNGPDERTGVPFPLVSARLLVKAIRLGLWADVIHTHDCQYVTSWAAWLGSMLTRTPLMLTQHVGLIAHPSRFVHAVQRMVHATFGRALLRHADQVIVLNSAVGKFTTDQGARPEAVRHLPNGIDVGQFRPARSADERWRIREHYALPQDRPLVLFVGRLVPKKGYDLLLRAADPAYDLVFVGSGSEGQRDARLTSADGVHFLGALSQDQVAEVYRGCDVFALPSTTEGFPLTIQEAMSSGLPLVTTDDPGYAPYLLDRGQVSLLPRDADVLHAELCALVKDRSRRESMGAYSRAYAERSFAWTEHARTLLDLYAEACSLDSARPTPYLSDVG